MQDKKSTSKPRYIFVGAVTKPPDGTLGGQLFACTLLMESPLGENVDWIPIDSTQKSLPPPPVWKRIHPALWRVLRCTFHLMRPSVKGGLIFSSYRTLSLLEKMLICLIGSLFMKQMVVTFRSEIRAYPKVDWFLRPLTGMAIRLGTRVICQSTEAESKLIQFYRHAKSNTVVIPNWIEPESYRVNPSDQQDTKTPQILFIGWLEKNKGVHDLLNALSLLKSDQLSFSLVVCGSGSQHRSLQQQASELDLESEVDFRGWVSGEEKDRVLAESQIFILPSYSEGMPNSVLEAMCCGLPIVATPVGGVPQLVCNEGALLVTPGAPNEIADAIEQLLRAPELRKKMGIANRKRIKQNHDIRTIWNKVADVMDVTS